MARCGRSYMRCRIKTLTGIVSKLDDACHHGSATKRMLNLLFQKDFQKRLSLLSRKSRNVSMLRVLVTHQSHWSVVRY